MSMKKPLAAKNAPIHTMRLIYTVWPDLDEAKDAVRSLLKQHLIACANIIAQPCHSLFIDNDTIKETKEFVAILKTTEDLIPRIIETVKTMHSYDTPAFIALPTSEVYKPYAVWLHEATSKARQKH